MASDFACPECGAEVELTGVAPGRQVQCAFCETWVEVPYLPRAGQIRRRRFDSKDAWKRWAFLGGCIAAAVVVLALLATLLIRTRIRSEREHEVTTLIESAENAAAAGRFEVAVFESEAALARLKGFEPVDSDRTKELRGKRDEFARREVQARLERIASVEPGAAVGACLTMLERSRADPAIRGLSAAIQEALEASRLRLAEAELTRGRQLLGAAKPAEAFEVGDAVARLVDLLPVGARPGIRDRADALLRDVVAAHGAVPFRLQGQYTLGSIENYQGQLTPIAVEALRRKGYFPPPPRTTRRDLWDRHAPYLLRFELRESQTGYYLQSRDRTTQIEAVAGLGRSGRDLWVGNLTARTTVPLPNLPAYLASRIAVSDRRDPEVERRLYDDAFGQLRDQFGMKLRGLPAWAP